eukprot:4997648-Pleurochrysis_carterae.AAC.1
MHAFRTTQSCMRRVVAERSPRAWPASALLLAEARSTPLRQALQPVSPPSLERSRVRSQVD